MSKDTPQMFTLAEVEEVLQVSRRSLYTYIKEGKLDAIRIGRTWRVTLEELQRLSREGITDKRTHKPDK